MGLIKDGIKYGALFGVAHEGFKAMGNKQQQQQQQQPQQPYYPPQQGYQPQPQPNRAVQENDGAQMWNDGNGYLHQAYCNGSCGSQCNNVKQG